MAELRSLAESHNCYVRGEGAQELSDVSFALWRRFGYHDEKVRVTE